MIKLHGLFLLCMGLTLFSCKNELPVEISQAYAELPDKVDFNFHIRPILSDRCFFRRLPWSQT